MAKIKQLIAASLLATMSALGASGAEYVALNGTSPSLTQDFNSMWNGTEATMSLPEGWRIDRNLDSPRSLNSFESASTEVMYTGGVSLPSNAKNGTWNFGSSSEPSDRAIGGLSTTVSGGTRCVSVMTCLSNSDATKKIDRLTISYDIEKYRKGANAAGFAVQMYTSTDGVNWTSAGSDFYTLFPADSETLGAEIVPISTTPVNNKTLKTDLGAGEKIYLAWNITVASGSTPDKAPGLALDNVSITANFVEPSADAHNVYIEDLTGWDKIMLHAADGSLGDFPGAMGVVGVKSVNGVSYTTFEVGKFPVTVALNNGVYYSLNPVALTEGRDYYFTATTKGMTEIADPTTYTGYVDPNRPAFKASGIYIRGEVNSWGSPAEWQFSDEGNGNYALYNKTLTGQFKVADSSWSGSCNYGSNGSNVYPDTPYELVSGTDSNISCGGNTFTCKEIRLNIAEGKATLTLTTDDDATGLTTVYAFGDFNGWNYMDASGALTIDPADGLFKGTISMPKSADGLSHWMIYQRLGMGGAWGAPDDKNQTESTISGKLEKGSTGRAAVAPGTYAISFNLTTGEYTLDRQASQIVDMTLQPMSTILVPTIPQTVKVLSLNNSLIHYSDQPSMFNEMSRQMGVDASWTKHTLLGKSLDTHWDEGEGLAADGTPGAKMMVRSDAWTHIILQEQSNKPITNPAGFKASVNKWIKYIRENCPNPNAIIIIPMNWGYSSDLDNFVSNNNAFAEIYSEVAADEGIIVCPVAMAYNAAYNALGGQKMTSHLFLDDRHPVDRSAYMAACMEYGLIFGVDPASITGRPSNVNETEAAEMRQYASQGMSNFHNVVNHNGKSIDFQVSLVDDNDLSFAPSEPVSYTIDGGGNISADGVFTSDGTQGTFKVTASNGTFTRTAEITVTEAKTEVVKYPAIEFNEESLNASENFDAMGNAADAAMPSAWRIDRVTSGPRTVGTYATASESTTYAGGVNLASNAKNGTWNFGANDEGDRAVGGITTGVENGSRAINVYTHLLNSGKKKLTNVVVTYDIEKYRNGSNPAGFAVQLYYSYNGNTWTSAGTDFYTYLDPDNATAGMAEVPCLTSQVSGKLPVDLTSGVDLYLAWNISPASGDACNNAMALAIDNVKIEASLPEVPTAKHYIYAEDKTGWNSIGLYAWGDSELFGAWPGEAPVDEREIDGVVYKVFLLDTESGNYSLIFNNWNNGSQAPDYSITANRDFYLTVTADKVVERDSSVGSLIDTNADSVMVCKDKVTAPGASSIDVYNAAGMLITTVAGDTLDLDKIGRGMYVVRPMGGNHSRAVKIAR